MTGPFVAIKGETMIALNAQGLRAIAYDRHGG